METQTRVNTHDGMTWLAHQMTVSGYNSLDELQRVSGINKGTLSKYFRRIQVPSVAVIPVLCKALNISPEELLIGLGVIADEKL